MNENNENQIEVKGSDDLVNEAFALNKETADSDRIAETLEALQAVIERNANELQNVEHELKEKREMLKNIFENDSVLAEAEHVAEEAAKKTKERKAEIQNNAQAVSLKLQIAEVNQNKKEIEEALSNHLVNYHSLTGSMSFDTSDGDQWDFSIRAKVKISR